MTSFFGKRFASVSGERVNLKSEEIRRVTLGAEHVEFVEGNCRAYCSNQRSFYTGPHDRSVVSDATEKRRR